MPKFLVTQGSYFQPFTYDELVKPLQQMADAQNTTQDAYDTMSLETEALRQYITDNPDDARAKELYDNYVSRLANLQNNLWGNGYTPQTRRDLSLARSGFANSINPLKEAIQRRQEQSKAYWDYKNKNRDAIMGRDPGTFGLDNYLGNTTFGQDWYAYSGKDFTNQVGAEAKARASSMLADPEVSKVPGLVGYLRMVERDGFTNKNVDDAYTAVRAALSGDSSLLGELDMGASILAGVLMSNIESTGAQGNVDGNEMIRLLDFGKIGLSQAVGEAKPNTVHDLQWAEQQKIARENERYQHNMSIAAMKAAARGNGNGSSSTASGSLGPMISSLRGNTLNGIADKKQSKDFLDKTTVYKSLSIINDLKKANALRQPNGALTDAANEAVMALYRSPYYQQLTGGKDRFLSTADLDSVLAKLGDELNKMETNDHLYSFEVTPAAAQNMARNVFKLNIGQLKGKQGDKAAAAFARYANGKAVSAKDLMSILEANNIAIGFDARSGDITIQRRASDSSEDSGNYDDRIVYLNPRVLSGTSARVNAGLLQEAFINAVPDGVSETTRREYENKIAAMSGIGQTVDLRDLAAFIKNSYSSLVKDGDENDRVIYNALVESFALGLFDSSNTQWGPNNYKEGWSAKTGGEYMPYGYYDDDDDIEFE